MARAMHGYALAYGPEDGAKTLAPGGGEYGVDKVTGAIRRLIPKAVARTIRKQERKKRNVPIAPSL